MLKFNNGKFRILQIADVQDTQITSVDTLTFMGKAIDEIKPDLVVFTGDQVKSYGVSIKCGNPVANMTKTIENLLKPLAERNTKFAFVFGNHDVPINMDRKWQADIYESYPNCVNGELLDRFNNTDVMCLPIYSEDEGEIASMIYLIDNCQRRNGAHGVSDEQMDFLDSFNNNYREVPSYVFQHIPVNEMYETLDEVPKNTKDALEGNISKRGHYYRVTPQMKQNGEYMGENIACPKENCGQFERWVKMGNIKAAFFGHDHNNCFSGTLKGIDLVYTPGAGFNVYGPGYDRAVRVIDLDADGTYETKTVTYRELMGKNIHNKTRFWVYNNAPSSVDEAVNIAKKKSPYILAAVVGTAVTYKLLKKSK